MASASPAALALALLTAGCNPIGHAQIGPVVAAREDTPYGGVEANANVYVDLKPADDPLAGRQGSETTSRWGLASGAYMRGTGLGFGMGVRPGLFFGATDAQRVLFGTAGLSLGMQTRDKTNHGNVGAYVMLGGGFTIRKTYDSNARLLCRSLLYLTASLQGNIDYLPAREEAIPSASVFLGVLGLEDAGASSDMSSGVNCPR